MKLTTKLLKQIITEELRNVLVEYGDYELIDLKPYTDVGKDKIAKGLYLGTLSDGFQMVLEKFGGFDKMLNLDNEVLAQAVELIVSMGDNQTVLKDIQTLNEMIDNTLRGDILELEEIAKTYEADKSRYIYDFARRKYGSFSPSSIEQAKKTREIGYIMHEMPFMKSLKKIRKEIKRIEEDIKQIQDKLIIPLKKRINQ